MTREMPSLLTTTEPRSSVPAKVTIGHIQLRDLVLCPHEHGTVIYPQQKSIVEHDITNSASNPRRIVDLPFIPNSLSTLVNPDSGETLLAAGGQEAELHLSLHGYPTSRLEGGGDSTQSPYFGRQRWKSEVALENASINNSVLLTSLSLTGSNESSVEPKVIISNNDKTVKFFDVAIRSGKYASERGAKRLSPAGQLVLDVPVNHSSISPDGRTLLSIGDSPDVYLHRISGGAQARFTQMTKLSLSPYISASSSYSYGFMSPYQQGTPVPASFSSSFSANGSKFAVASQEGVVVVWDVRSTKPLKVIETDKNRVGTTSGRWATGNASGWVYDSPWDWGRGQAKAPGWGVRSVKFSPTGVGREVLTFTEHTSLLHVLDARTFETSEIVRVPYLDSPPISRPATVRPRSPSPPVSHPSVASATTNTLIGAPLPPPPRIMLFSGALEDTFRIPSADTIGTSTANRRRRSARRAGLQNRESALDADEDGDAGIVVIPPLGDREVDDDIWRLFQGRRALRSAQQLARASEGDDSRHPEDREAEREERERAEEEMDVDELESDCVSSYNPSRANSPVPGTSARVQNAPQTQSQASTQTATSSTSSVARLDATRRASLLERRESSGPYMTRRGSSQTLRRNRRLAENGGDTEVEVDLAGVCFDPSGEYIYAASTRGISEWRVRGAEQTWWSEFVWA
ncbi:hypothetical protein BDY19DRAFT_991647 [Irpex rosettiformis]|uniref:Uncharacterized protein n=1 Tax=Irpex rosettiformis TaxID=378272 RepID=A0ACB8U9X5_9APHY|nr:hypothetical protein BDY19DRAFT_991647 [Irpex rosettiformis]